ncbi:MAG: azurin [Steroidobacteraceae bacterium]|nr:azurin [Steroidobacteraceae bacterium]
MKLTRTLATFALLAVSASAFAQGKVCAVDIAGGDNMQFDKKEIAVAADCTEIEVTLKHTGKLPAQAMGHNWVLTKTADLTAAATDGMGAGFANEHVKPGDARVLAHTKIVGGGQTTSIKFPASKLKKGEAYSFFCSFPGHFSIMRGTFKFG